MDNPSLRADVFGLLTDYGTPVEVLLATVQNNENNRFRQRGIVYGDPITVLGHKVFGKNEEMRLLAQLPDGMQFDATVTFGSEHLREATGRTSKDVLTVTDRIRFDSQTWEIVATHYTGEVRGEFLVLVAFLRSLDGEYQRPELRP